VIVLPIELWQQVVDITFAQPQQHIGIEVVVVGLPGMGRGAFGIAAAITPDTKGADAELYIGLLCLYLGIELGYEEGDVVAAPIVFAHALAIAAVAAIVAKLPAGYAVGVEVIVEVYGIYIVALYHVHNDLKDIGAGIRIAGVYE